MCLPNTGNMIGLQYLFCICPPRMIGSWNCLDLSGKNRVRKSCSHCPLNLPGIFQTYTHCNHLTTHSVYYMCQACSLCMRLPNVVLSIYCTCQANTSCSQSGQILIDRFLQRNHCKQLLQNYTCIFLRYKDRRLISWNHKCQVRMVRIQCCQLRWIRTRT